MSIADVVGSGYVRAGAPQDAVDWVIPRHVVSPGNADEVAAVLRLARDAGWQVLPRGGGTKLGWGNRPEGADVVLELGRMAAVVDHAWGDMTATVQAGCTMAQLQATLAAHGQRLAIDSLWPEQATVGGILSTNDTGAMRVRFGGLRDQVIGMTVALADGTLAKSGGRVVKNVAGYDLPKLMTGALGTLGVIVEATFRLYPLPLAIRDCCMTLPHARAAEQVLLALNDSTLAPAAVQLCLASAGEPRLDVRFEGVDTVLATQQHQLGELTRAALDGMRRDDGSTEPFVPAEADQIWHARQALWDSAETALISKVSWLIADFSAIMSIIEGICAKLHIEWRLVLNGQGVGMLRMDGENDEALLTGLVAIRHELAQFDASVSAFACPLAIKSRIDVWGDTGDTLALMQRVKQRFDPTRMLNAGRFVGRI